MITRGLVIGGVVVPETERIMVDSDAFFTDGRWCRRRAKVINKLVGHWTGGEATLRSYNDDGPFVYRVLKGRTKNGKPLTASVHFVIGACNPDDEWAPIWQIMDPGLFAAIHVNKGFVNASSIGVEIVNAGTGPNLRKRPLVQTPFLGKIIKVADFYPGQYRAWIWLANLLSDLDGRGGISIPRQVPVLDGNRRLTLQEARRWAGGLEHMHTPGTTKKDAAGLLTGALRYQAGWAPVNP